MSMEQFNISYDAMNDLIKKAETESKNEKREFKALEDGVYIAEIKELGICPSKSSGKPMLKITFHVTSDNEETTTYNQNVWDYTVLAGTSNDGFMCWLAKKKLENFIATWEFSGDWNKDAERIKSEVLPTALNSLVYLDVKTGKNDKKQYKIVGCWDK